MLSVVNILKDIVEYMWWAVLLNSLKFSLYTQNMRQSSIQAEDMVCSVYYGIACVTGQIFGGFFFCLIAVSIC
jgi:hypothetical protein